MIGAIIMGALVGWIAGKLMNLEGGLLRNIVVGVIGSFVGRRGSPILANTAHPKNPNHLEPTVGACLFIWLGRKIFH